MPQSEYENYPLSLPNTRRLWWFYKAEDADIPRDAIFKEGIWMIIAITGSMGSGKTLLTTALAYQYYNQGSVIYANYGLKFPYKPLKMEDISNCDFDYSNALLIFDEIHLFMDSRTSASKKNRIISYFITQSRKRNIVLIYTTQQSHQIDKRLRSNTDYFISCENLSPKNSKEDVFIKWTLNDMDQHRKTFVFKADPFFNLYDTHQMIDFSIENKKDLFLPYHWEKSSSRVKARDDYW